MYALLSTEESPLRVVKADNSSRFGPFYSLMHKGDNLNGNFYLGIPDSEIAADDRHVEAARVYSINPLSELSYEMTYSEEKMRDMAEVLEYISGNGIPFFVEVSVDGNLGRFFGRGDTERLLQLVRDE